MKKFLVILLFIPIKGYSQSDSIVIPRYELIEVFSAIDTLLYKDSIKNVLIHNLNSQIKNYELLSKNDSLLISYKDRQIEILNREISLYNSRVNRIDKWYNRPWINFLSGCATMTLSSWILKNISN